MNDEKNILTQYSLSLLLCWIEQTTALDISMTAVDSVK